MSTLKVDKISNNGSAVDFPNGIKVNGADLSPKFTSSATEPSSPIDGEWWWDTTNQKLYRYINDIFKFIDTDATTLIPSNYAIPTGAANDHSAAVGNYDSNPYTMHVAVDGYTVAVGGLTTDDVFLGRMTTQWDITTLSASEDNSLGYLSNPDTTPTCTFFSTDGDYFYCCGWNTDDIDRYSCPTAFSLAGHTNDQTNTSVMSGLNPTSIWFNNTGTRLFFTTSSERLYAVDLSTAWDVSTSSATRQSSYWAFANDITGNVTHTGGLWLSQDGKQIVLGNQYGNGQIHYGTFGTPWDITTITIDNDKTLDLSGFSGITSIYDISFNDTLDRMYVLNNATDRIYQLDLDL